MNSDILEYMTSQKKDPKYLKSKFDEQQLMNNKLASFILEYLHLLCWKKWPVKADGNYIDTKEEAVISTIDLKKAFSVVLPAFNNLIEVLNEALDEKYPSQLISASLEKKKREIEVEHDTEKYLNKVGLNKKQK